MNQVVTQGNRYIFARLATLAATFVATAAVISSTRRNCEQFRGALCHAFAAYGKCTTLGVSCPSENQNTELMDGRPTLLIGGNIDTLFVFHG